MKSTKSAVVVKVVDLNTIKKRKEWHRVKVHRHSLTEVFI